MDKQAFTAKCMEIKAKISVAKDNLNDFGGYKYRTIEDILAVAKPVLVGTGIELQTDVDVSIIGDKFLVTAYATLTDGENRETTKGLAFYDADHKKMSDEQKLGSASTYAIRYAMTNLLLAGSGEADLDSLPPKDYKGQQTTRTQQAAPTYQAPRQQYQQRPAQAPRQQYQQPAQRQQAAPARQQVTAPAPTAPTAPLLRLIRRLRMVSVLPMLSTAITSSVPKSLPPKALPKRFTSTKSVSMLRPLCRPSTPKMPPITKTLLMSPPPRSPKSFTITMLSVLTTMAPSSKPRFPAIRVIRPLLMKIKKALILTKC